MKGRCSVIVAPRNQWQKKGVIHLEGNNNKGKNHK